MAKAYGQNTAVDFAPSNLITFNGSFSRGAGQPLDKTAVWYSTGTDDNYVSGYDRARSYAASDAAYIGQVIAVIDPDKTALYVITDASGNLQPLTLRELFTAEAHNKILTWDDNKQLIVPKEIKYCAPEDDSDAGLLSFFE